MASESMQIATTINNDSSILTHPFSINPAINIVFSRLKKGTKKALKGTRGQVRCPEKKGDAEPVPLSPLSL